MAKKDLSSKQQQALALLVAGQTQETVAHAVKVRPQTVREWLREATFRDELRLALERMRQTFEARMMGLANNSAAVLQEVLADTNDKERQLEGVKVVINAAVRLANRYKELQVEGFVAPAQPLVVFPAGTRFPWQRGEMVQPPVPLEIEGGDVIDAEATEVSDDPADNGE